jgi:hypothetical protein
MYTLSLHDALPISGSFVPAVIVCTVMTGTEAICGLMLKETGSQSA